MRKGIVQKQFMPRFGLTAIIAEFSWAKFGSKMPFSFSVQPAAKKSLSGLSMLGLSLIHI